MLFWRILIICMNLPVINGFFYNCSTFPIHLNTNEVGFFQTKNYPSLEFQNDFTACNFQFTAWNHNLSNFNVFVAFSYFFFNEVSSPLYDVVSFVSTDTITVSIYDYVQMVDVDHDGSELSLQGMVIFDDTDNSCPMEVVARNQPFHLENENIFFYIQSSFNKNEYRKFPCQWQFTAPEGYGFKIYITQLDISSTTQFIVSNSTTSFLNHGSVYLYYPSYNEDNYIIINLSIGDPTFVTEMELEGYITIVKKNSVTHREHCKTRKTYESTIWYLHLTDNFYDFPTAYLNNAECEYKYYIPKNKGCLINYDKYALESNADYVIYSIDKNISYRFTEWDYNLFLGPYPNEPNKEISWKFKSDGSFSGLGFSITFSNIECTCPKLFVPCHTGVAEHFCNNVLCKFAIGRCHWNLRLLSIHGSDNMNIKITSNNFTVFEIRNFTKEEVKPRDIIVNEKAETFVEIYTSDAIGYLSFDIAPSETPKIDSNITISLENPALIINVKSPNFIAVNMSEELVLQNRSFVIYSNLGYGVPIYNNQSLTQRITSKTCFSSNLFKCVIKASEFAIYQFNEEHSFIFSYPFLVIQYSGPAEGCIMKENVFVLSYDTKSVVSIANEKECKIYLLIDNNHVCYISRLWTTSPKQNIRGYIGMDQKYLYFEANAKTAKTWQMIVLDSPVYTIIIPPKTTLFISLQSDLVNFNKSITLSYPLQSMFATPYFGTEKHNILATTLSPYYGPYFYNFEIKNFSAKFTIFNYKIEEIDDFHFWIVTNDDEKQRMYVKKPGDSFTFKNQTVYIKYYLLEKNIDKEDNDYGAMFFIETFNDNKTKSV